MRRLAAAVVAVLCTPAVRAQESEPVSFFRDVRPILQEHCQGCHQPAKLKGDLSLVSYADMMRGIAGEDPVVVAGDPGDSLLLEVVTAVDGERPAMPEEGDPLAAAPCLDRTLTPTVTI